MAEQTTIAAFLVPNRDDGLISLHIGPSWVLLSPDEANAVARTLAMLAAASQKPETPEFLRSESVH